MSQPFQSAAVEQPALTPGGRATLWCGPHGLTGLQLRTAVSNDLPIGQQVAVLAVVVLPASAGMVATFETGSPAFWPLGIVVAFAAVIALCRWGLTRKRRAHGMVLLTPLQFDLVVALDQLPADRVDAGRQLHDRLVWLLQQPVPDPTAVQDCERWMWRLATGR